MAIASLDDERRSWSFRLWVFTVAVLVVAVGGVMHAPAATAHSGPIELTLAPDGVGGFQLRAHYEEDGHPVEEIMDAVLVAEAPDGQTIGPVSFVSSPEGRGRWVTSEPVLDNGDWTVTVSTTVPAEASVTMDVTVEPLAPPVNAEPAQVAANPVSEPAATDSEPEAATVASDDGARGQALSLWLIAGAVAVALVAAGAVMWRKVRA